MDTLGKHATADPPRPWPRSSRCGSCSLCRAPSFQRPRR